MLSGVSTLRWRLRSWLAFFIGTIILPTPSRHCAYKSLVRPRPQCCCNLVSFFTEWKFTFRKGPKYLLCEFIYWIKRVFCLLRNVERWLDFVSCTELWTACVFLPWCFFSLHLSFLSFSSPFSPVLTPCTTLLFLLLLIRVWNSLDCSEPSFSAFKRRLVHLLTLGAHAQRGLL